MQDPATMDTAGLVVRVSQYSVKVTIDRLADAATAMGIMVFARIDHAAGAVQAGMALRPTELLIFGNPKAGTPLMQANQAAGIDLPLKMLSWEDESSQVLLAYNQPQWVGHRHGLGAEMDGVLAALAQGLAKLAQTATE